MRVRGPFMIEGAIYGVIATLITLVLFLPATIWLGNNMTSFLGINMYDYYVSNFFQIFVMQLMFAAVFYSYSSAAVPTTDGHYSHRLPLDLPSIQ